MFVVSTTFFTFVSVLAASLVVLAVFLIATMLNPFAQGERKMQKQVEKNRSNLVIFPSSTVYNDRRNLLRWSRKLNQQNSCKVGGIITIVKEDELVEDGRKCLKSLTSGEIRYLPASCDVEKVHEVYEWAREEILTAFDANVEIIVMDELGPEAIHGLGLDAALRAVIWRTKEDPVSTLLVCVVEDSLVGEFEELYGIQRQYNDLVHLNSFKEFLRWGQSSHKFVVWEGNKRGVYNSKSFESTDEEETNTKQVEHAHHGTGPFYMIIRYPLLALTMCVVFFELSIYIMVRQAVNLFEGVSRKNRRLHQQLNEATHYASWRRIARKLDVLERRSGGSVAHFPTIAQFSKSLATLNRQLTIENRRASLENGGVGSDVHHKEETRSRGSDDDNASGSGYMDLTPEHELLGCVRACVTSLVELVTEQLYSGNFVGTNLELRDCLENLMIALSNIEKTDHADILQLKYWQELRIKILAQHPVIWENQDEGKKHTFTLEDVKKGHGPSTPRHRVATPVSAIATLRNDPEISKSKLLLEHLEALEKELVKKESADSGPPEISGLEMEDLVQQAFRESKQRYFSELAHAFGETALCLSGGASNGYYHLGVVRELLDRDELPLHITGASGGALIGSFVATRTDEELRDILHPEKVYKLFDPIGPGGHWGLFQHLRKHGTLFNYEDWKNKMCNQICGDMTFREAFEKTGRSFTITVFNVDRKGRQHTRALNYVTTPDVVIYSAVLASSALPKLLPPIELLRKDSRGNVTPYHSLGKFWRDGSFENELPFEALRQLFNVTFTIVSQVEPHITLFFYDNRGAAGKAVAHLSGKGWRGGFILAYLERLIKLDLRKWLELIKTFNLMPYFVGTDITSVFLGRSRGNVTLLPPILMHSYLNLISDPDTPAKMRHYMDHGKRMVFSKIPMINDRLKLERRLQELAAKTF